MSEPAKIDLEAIRERTERSHRELSDLCAPGHRWTMHIPADPERDSDLIIGASIKDLDDLTAAVASLTAENERLRKERDDEAKVLAAWERRAVAAEAQLGTGSMR